MGPIYYEQGDYRQAMACFQQTLTALQGVPPDQFFVVLLHPSVNARAWMVLCLSELGAFADGVAYGAEALQIAEAVERPYERLTVYTRVGLLHVRQGSLHQAIPLLERAVALCQEANISIYYRLSAASLALAHALAGRATDALAVLEQMVGNIGSLPKPLACGEPYLLAGCVEEAYRVGQRGLAHARHRKMLGREAWALRLLGEIALRCDPPDVAPAEAHYQQSLALAEALGMRPLVAHCHHGLGRLYGQTGRSEQVRAALSTAIALYRAMDMTFWLPQAEAALTQVA
jgi:tetratricopeptide (TPR) repeat protein